MRSAIVKSEEMKTTGPLLAKPRILRDFALKSSSPSRDPYEVLVTVFHWQLPISECPIVHPHHSLNFRSNYFFKCHFII